MTSTQQFILALIPLVITWIIKLIFEIKSVQLANLKENMSHYRETIRSAEVLAENIFKEGHGEEKFNYVLDLVSKKIKMPREDLKALIEDTLFITKKQFGEEWDKLGRSKGD